MLQFIPETSGSQLRGVTIKLGGVDVEVISVNTSALLSKQNFHRPENLFAGINSYWAHCSAQKQKDIFACYEEFSELVSMSSLTLDTTKSKVFAIMRRLVNLHPWSEVIHTPGVDFTVIKPDSVKDTIPDQYKFQPKEKTYVSDEYYALGRFVHYFRFMLPIIVRMLRDLKVSEGKDECERTVFRMINQTKIATIPEYKRLMSYVDSFFDGRSREYNAGLSISELSVEDIPDVMKARVIVKTLLSLEPDKPDKRDSRGMDMITTISHRLNRRFDDLKSGYNGNQLRTKKNVGKSSDDPNGRLSSLEVWKLPTDVSNHTKGLRNAYASRILSQLQRVAKPEDLATLKARVEETHEHVRLRDITTMNNAMYGSFGVVLLNRLGALHHLHSATLLNNYHWEFSVVTAVLDYMGYSDLALVANLRAWELDRGVMNPTELNIPVATLLEKPMQDRFEELYPYYTPESGDKKRNRRNNFGYINIDKTVLTLTQQELEYDGPNWLLDKHSVSRGTTTSLPSNIKQRLAELTIDLVTFKPLVTAEDLLRAEFPDAL